MTQTAQGEAQPDRSGLPGVPKPALALGFAGLLPFIALSGAMLAGPPDLASGARPVLLGYAIAILSFMGGVHWGLAMAGSRRKSEEEVWRRYGISVLPALGGAAALLLAPQFQFLWLTACFAVLLAYDLRASARGETTGWYPALRSPLTAVVCVCLGAVALFGF